MTPSPTQNENLERLLRAILAGQSGCPVFPTDGIVSREELQKFFRVGNDTIQSWHDLGLKPRGPGLKQYFYFAKDVVDLFAGHAIAHRIRSKRTRKRKPK